MWGCLQTELDAQWLRHYDTRCQGREANVWKIRTRGFTLQEVLIMAAMNVAAALIATDKGEREIWRSREHPELQGTRSLSWQE